MHKLFAYLKYKLSNSAKRITNYQVPSPVIHATVNDVKLRASDGELAQWREDGRDDFVDEK